MRRMRRIGVLVAACAVISATMSMAGSPPAAAEPPGVDPAAVQMAQDWGLSRGESQARLERQEKIMSLAADLTAAFPARYGGMWVDHAQGGMAMAGFTEAVPRQRLDQLARRHGISGHVRGVVVRFTMAHLEQSVNQLADGLPGANRGAQRTISLAVRQDLNRIELTVPDGVPLTDAQQEFVRTAQARYGEALVQVTSNEEPDLFNCIFPYCDVALRGGIGIDSGGCTSGFIATPKSGSAPFILTAGHCIPGTPQWTTQSVSPPATRDIGPSWNFSFGFSGDPDGFGGDMGIILIAAEEEYGPWVYSNHTRYKILGAIPFTPVPGMYLCKTGRTSFIQCGRVAATNQVVWYKSAGQLVIGLIRASVFGCKGDSGGPNYAHHLAYGITSGGSLTLGGSCGLTTYFQYINTATAAMGVKLLVSQ